MRKIYLLLMITGFSYHGLQAQNCTNVAASACTGGVTENFNSDNRSFTTSVSSGSQNLTYNATNGRFEVNKTGNSSVAFTVTSPDYYLLSTGGSVGFSMTGTTAGISAVTVRVRRATDDAVLFTCNQVSFAAANQTCVSFGPLAPDQVVYFQFVITNSNGNPGNGLITFDNFANGGATAPLPVKLDNFEASKEGSAVKLTWKTDQEDGVAKYEIQRSSDGVNFLTIGSIAANNARSYDYIDALPSSANNFYRLRIVDVDNIYRVSHIVSIKSKVSLKIEAYPNPVRDRMIVQHPKAIGGSRMQVVNLNGQVLRDIQIPVNAVVTPVDMTGFSNGTYYIVFRSGTESFSQRITKQ